LVQRSSSNELLVHITCILTSCSPLLASWSQ